MYVCMHVCEHVPWKLDRTLPSYLLIITVPANKTKLPIKIAMTRTMATDNPTNNTHNNIHRFVCISNKTLPLMTKLLSGRLVRTPLDYWLLHDLY